MLMECQLVGLLYRLFSSTRVQATVADNHLHDFVVHDTYTHLTMKVGNTTYQNYG